MTTIEEKLVVVVMVVAYGEPFFFFFLFVAFVDLTANLCRALSRENCFGGVFFL